MTLLLTSAAPGQELDGDKVDLAALAQLKNEAFQHSQVMENLFYISEVYGPRVNNSRNHRAAAEWAMQRMTSPRTVRSEIDDAATRMHGIITMMVILASGVAVLAVMGIYGVVWFAVSRPTK